MTEELANVVSIEQGVVTLASQIKTTCGSCSQVDTCANGQVAKALPKRQLSFTIPLKSVPADISVNVGDCVVLGVPETDLLVGAAQVYLLPLLGLVSFGALGQWLVEMKVINHELAAIAIALVGGYLGYRFAKYRQNQQQSYSKLQPKILRVLPSTENVE